MAELGGFAACPKAEIVEHVKPERGGKNKPQGLSEHSCCVGVVGYNTHRAVFC